MAREVPPRLRVWRCQDQISAKPQHTPEFQQDVYRRIQVLQELQAKNDFERAMLESHRLCASPNHIRQALFEHLLHVYIHPDHLRPGILPPDRKANVQEPRF